MKNWIDKIKISGPGIRDTFENTFAQSLVDKVHDFPEQPRNDNLFFHVNLKEPESVDELPGVVGYNQFRTMCDVLVDKQGKIGISLYLFDIHEIQAQLVRHEGRSVWDKLYPYIVEKNKSTGELNITTKIFKLVYELKCYHRIKGEKRTVVVFKVSSKNRLPTDWYNFLESLEVSIERMKRGVFLETGDTLDELTPRDINEVPEVEDFGGIARVIWSDGLVVSLPNYTILDALVMITKR